jgi:hypothetical protein
MPAVQAITNSKIGFAFESMGRFFTIGSLIGHVSSFSTWMMFNHAD